MPRPLPPPADIHRLLIVKTSSIGDVIHALPVVQAIRQGLPHAAVDWVVRARSADVLRGNPWVDKLHVLPDRPSIGDLWALRNTLRAARYGLALDMQGLLLSGVITRLSGAPLRVGWDRDREGNALFLTHPIVPGGARDRHEVDLLYGFAGALGVPADHAEFTSQPYLAADGADRAAGWLSNLPRPRVALNVGAGRAYKRWPLERWGELASALGAAGVGLIFVGDKSDALDVARITPGLPPRFVDVSGKTTLRELASVLAACDLLVSGDSGPMHLAVAVGTPVVALFGATDPRRHGPYGGRNTVLHDPAPGAMVPGRRPTPEAGAASMERISVERVVGEVLARLGKCVG